ncbi:MAG TPA: UDP-N-acetylmuramoyl-tripeptide--D-alanyl-D-alanine ligase [Polyangiales bacterium]|nr:UDP-N-acetylmuramoyl-tripeptide--D-alanyl-D-alanine ligase [Polyangiales bacterium]
MATRIPTNHARFRADEVVSATQGVLRGPAWEEVCGVVTDSREVQPGNLFVALRGEHFDAHQFAVRAFEAGAAAIMVEAGTPLPAQVSAIEVDDTLHALGELAKAHRNAWNGKLIAITGSVGKTTTKELLTRALRAGGHRVLATTGNLNNRIGVPMTLFELDDSVDVAVIEMGTSQPGEIARLAEIGAPDVAIVTRASLAHTQGLGSVEAVADEKVSLLQALAPDGVAVAYGDDAPVKKRASVVRAKRKIFYGVAAENDVRVLDWTVDSTGTSAHFQVRGKDVEIHMGLLGEGAVLNAAGALAIILGLGASIEDAARGIAEVESPPGRMQPKPALGDRLLIDDTYNANPASMKVALEATRAIAQKRDAPLIVVLGDMKELGTHSEEAHRKVGELVASNDVFLFIGVGEAMHAAVAAANERGTDTLWFERAADCGQIIDRLPLHSVVLIKGSRSMEMERVVDPLLEGQSR